MPELQPHVSHENVFHFYEQEGGSGISKNQTAF